MLLIGTSCRNEGGVIKGEIANLKTSYMMVSYPSADSLAVDTIFVNPKGKFNYPTNIDTLTTFSLYMNDYEGSTVVFADKGQKLSVKGDAAYPDLIRVNGNELNNDLTAFKISNEDLLKQRGQKLEQLQEMNSINRHEEISKLNVLNHELTLNAEEFIKDNPTKLSSLILISNFFTNSDNPGALERVLGYLEGEVTKTEMAARLTAYSEKLNRSAEGATIPYFQLKDQEGNLIRSSDFSGKYVVMSFISTSGVESREMVDLLKNARENLAPDSVEFVTVYIDSENYPVEYVEQDSIPWTVVTEERGWGADIVDNFNVEYVPFNILISPDRKIQVRNIAAQVIVDEINKLSEKNKSNDIE